jgi:hypothetical protein
MEWIRMSFNWKELKTISEIMSLCEIWTFIYFSIEQFIEWLRLVNLEVDKTHKDQIQVKPIVGMKSVF